MRGVPVPEIARELHRSWEGKLSVTMRLTGEVRTAQIFVAVMGASNFTYVEATWTQALADWIGAHTRSRCNV